MSAVSSAVSSTDLVSPVKLTTRSDQLHILGSGLRDRSLRELLIHPFQIRRGIDDLGRQGSFPRRATPGVARDRDQLHRLPDTFRADRLAAVISVRVGSGESAKTAWFRCTANDSP